MRPHSPYLNQKQWIRALTGIVLCASVLLTSSGCVYWRLHQFRNQLSAFPENFRIEEDDAAPTIIALRPVLRPDDLGWLTGLAPSETVQHPHRTIERYHYVKDYADPYVRESENYDLLMLIQHNAAGRMHRIQAPARFAPILTVANFDEVFRPMKDGTLDRDNTRHHTEWVWEEHRVNIPSREDIVHFFGEPYLKESKPEGEVYLYTYQLQGNRERQNPTGWDVFIRFAFAGEEERIAYTDAYIGRIRIQVDLRETQNKVHITRE